MTAFCRRADTVSRSPVWRFREKFGKNVADIWMRTRCPARNTLLVTSRSSVISYTWPGVSSCRPFSRSR